MKTEFKTTQRFVPSLMAFSKNDQNSTFDLKSVVFKHFGVYFQRHKCLFISPLAFTITFSQI